MRSRSCFLLHPVVVSAVVALLVVGVLYVDTLALPLFSDDLVQIPWLESISWRQLWTSPSPYGYYRPLWYSIWRVWGGLVGGLHPPGLHLLNLIAHGVATSLTGLLIAGWLPGSVTREERAVAAALAAAFFAVFPFSRQAVAWPGAVYNPLVSAMATAAVLAYDRGRAGGSGLWIGIALLMGAVAPFTYESGIVVAPLLVGVEVIGWSRGRWRNGSWWAMAFIALFVLTSLLWRSMRGVGVVASGLTPIDLWHNTAYLIQGLIYPVAPLVQWFAGWVGLDPVLALWLGALPTAALLGWWAVRHSVDVLLLGAAWFVVFALPPLVSMKADWFALAPRFLYMTAAGVSLIWAGALGPWIARGVGVRRVAVAALVLAALLIPAACFVRQGIRLYHMAGESIWDAARVAAAGGRVLLVNLPRRITPVGRVYPLGFEGVTPLPMRVTADGLVYVHTGVRNAANAVAFGVVATEDPEGYSYELFGRPAGWQDMADAVRDGGIVYLTRYESERIRLVEAGNVERTPINAGSSVQFGNRVDLLDTSCSCDQAGRVRLTAWWRAPSGVEPDVSVFAHLLSSEETLVAQADGRPLLGMFPFWMWSPGEVVRDVRQFAPVESGTYRIRLGIWEPAKGERWQATNGLGDAASFSVRCP
ncbi:MAG: hypothetical protein R6X31_12920 [Anaerolineae bacterium]